MEKTPPVWLRFVGREHRRLILAVLALVFLVGCGYSIYLEDRLRYLPDESHYLLLAGNLAARGTFSLDSVTPTAYRAPGYPAMLSWLSRLGGNILTFRLLNFLLLDLSIWILYLVLAGRFSPRAGVIGALLVLGYPVLIYTAGTLYPQTLAATLLLLAIFLLTRRSLSIGQAFFAGIICGWLVLTTPALVFLVFILIAWLWLQKVRTGVTISFLAAFCLLLGAWTVRNYRVFGTFVFVSTTSGENLLLGNSENTSPNSGRRTDISAYEAQTAGLDEAGRDRYFRSKAVEYILAHPTRSVGLYILKLANYFNFRNDLVTALEESPLYDLGMGFSYGLILGLFLLRVLLVRRYPLSSFELLLICIYLSSALVSAVFFTRIRFRIPFDYLLIMLDAIFLEALLRRRFPVRDLASTV